MEQKIYSLPKVGGGEVKKTLAPPKLKRVADFLELLGIKDLDTLRTPEGQIDYGMSAMKTGADPEKLIKLFDICLIEGKADVDFGELDLRVSDEVIQDFFEQRSKTLKLRMQSQ